MGRALSVRRPALDVARREAERIHAKQDAAIRRWKSAVVSWGEHDPRTRALHDETALSERDLAILESVANVAAKLEKVRDAPALKRKVDPEKAKALCDALEQQGPPPPPSTGDDEEPTH